MGSIAPWSVPSRWLLDRGTTAAGHLGWEELVITGMRDGFCPSHITPLAVQNHDGRKTHLKIGLCPTKDFCPAFVLLMLVKRTKKQVGQKTFL